MRGGGREEGFCCLAHRIEVDGVRVRVAVEQPPLGRGHREAEEP